MAAGKLNWDAVGEHFFETGVDQGVLFVSDGQGGYEDGVAWNGLTNVAENPDGAEATDIYADNIKYLNLLSNEEFALTLEALTYPDEFSVCDGSATIVEGFKIGQQKRKEFALCYRTLIGNDEDGTDKGYQIHIVYNCLAAPTERAHNTVNDTPETMTMSWSISTTQEEFTVGSGSSAVTYKASAHVVLDSTVIAEAKMTAILNKLWGTDNADAQIQTPDEIATIING